MRLAIFLNVFSYYYYYYYDLRYSIAFCSFYCRSLYLNSMLSSRLPMVYASSCRFIHGRVSTVSRFVDIGNLQIQMYTLFCTFVHLLGAAATISFPDVDSPDLDNIANDAVDVLYVNTPYGIDGTHTQTVDHRF